MLGGFLCASFSVSFQNATEAFIVVKLHLEEEHPVQHPSPPLRVQ